MSGRFGYRSALYLSALIAIVHGSFFIYMLMHPSRYLAGMATYVIAAVAIFVGLWLSSQVARYAGAAFYLLCAGAAAVPLLSSFKTLTVSVAVLWSIAMGALSLANALILVLSRSFDREYETERKTRPVYKIHLGKALLVLTLVLVVAATLNDM